MGGLRVEVDEPTAVDGPDGSRLHASAHLDPPLLGVDRVWWSIDRSPRLEPGPAADAALLGVVAPAMVHGLDVEVVGLPVTPGLLAGVDRAQQAWHQWRGWSPVQVHAEEAAPAPLREGGAVLAFSGGVDSSYSAWRHLTGTAGHEQVPIDAAVLVEGFDIPLDHPSMQRAADRVAPPLAERGVPVVRAATNLRALHEDWQAYHGFALASLLTFAGGGQRTGLIAATDTLDRPVLGWGSNAITDPLLGSDAFAIRYDGPVDRVAKLRALADWPDTIDRLRFCWAGADHATNCGRCLKCATTAMALQVLDLPTTCFEVPPSDATICEILRSSPPHGFTITYNQPILDEAMAGGIDAPWVPVLRARLRRARYGPAFDALATPVRRRLQGTPLRRADRRAT